MDILIAKVTNQLREAGSVSDEILVAAAGAGCDLIMFGGKDKGCY